MSNTPSSFYGDAANYATDYPTQNDSNTEPVSGNTVAPSSFYPNGTVYVESDEAAAAASASEAAASAAAALASQNAAAASATSASTSATGAAGSATAAGTSAANAATSAGAASTSATSASNSATNAYTNATSAQGSATSAATSATNAGNSATAASGSATTAGTSATNAANSATAAAGSATSAATSATNAAASVQAAAGTVNPVVNGTVAVGTSTKWAHEDHVHPSDTSRLAATNNLSDVANAKTARANLGIPTVLRSYLAGLTMAYVSATSFSVAAGVATDSTNVDSLYTTASLTKTTSAWAAGTSAGALDTGTIAASTWYHVFIIKNATTNVTDFLISLSLTAPTMPSGYTLFRRIGSLKTNASSQWVSFVQVGDEFMWSTPVADVSAYALTSTATNFALSVPPGVNVRAVIQGDWTASSGTNVVALVWSPLIGTQAPGTPAGNWSLNCTTISAYSTNAMEIITNTSSQVTAASSGSGTFYIITRGWIDHRGRDS